MSNLNFPLVLQIQP